MKHNWKSYYYELVNYVEQTLGKALHYPWYKDDTKNFPDATVADGVCTCDHVAESIIDEAARTIKKLEQNPFKFELFRFEEDRIFAEVFKYVKSTYDQHYSIKENNVQALDLMRDPGGFWFCKNNALKYLSRLGKKKNQPIRQELLKSIHYAILALKFQDYLDNSK